MDRIQLAQLRDVAIEYLPAAQEQREMLKKYWASETTFNNSLYLAAIRTLCKAGATAPELAAAQLLEAIVMLKNYDPNSPELEEFDPEDLREIAIRNIGNAVKTLAKVTGRDMEHLIPAATYETVPAVKVEAGAGTSQSGKKIPGKMPRTSIGKLAIKAAWQIECETNKLAIAKQVIEKLQALVETEPELLEKIPHGVKWSTTKGLIKSYLIEACAKTLNTWQTSRA